MRKHAVSIVLIVLAVSIATYAWLYDRGSVTDAERAARTTSVLPAFRRAEITRIEIARAAIDGRAAETIVLERDASDEAGAAPWRMTSPRREPANIASVEALLAELEHATRIRKVEGPAAGLDAPRARATITMGTITYVLALGGAAQRPDGAVYAKLDAETPIVVHGELAARLLASSDSYREKTIAPYGASEIAKLEIHGGSEIAVERGANGDFVLIADKTRASRAALDHVWSAIAEMRAESFLSDAEADALIAMPAFTLVATPRDGARARTEIVVGGACPGHDEDVVVVRRSPEPRISACAPRAVASGLLLLPDALPDRHLFAANPDEVSEMRIRGNPTAIIDVARAGSGWHQRLPTDRTLAQDEVEAANTLVLALTRAEGTLLDRDEWLTKPRTVAGAVPFAPDGVVTITRSERGEERIEIRQREAGSVVIRRHADDAFLRVSLATVRLLEPRAVALRGRDIVVPSIESSPVASLALRCGVAQDVVHGDRWTMTTPAGFAVDTAVALDVANALTHAKADVWIADTDDGSFGFAQSKCNAAIVVRDDGGTRKLALVLGSDAGDGGVYARVEGEAPVFVVARSVRDAMKKLLVDRGGVSVDLASATSITLARRGAKTAFDVRGGHLRGDAGARAAIEAALASLRADIAIHIGAATRDEGFDAPTLEIRVASADAGAPRVITFGLVTTIDDEKLYFARVSGVDATFGVAKATVDALLGAMPR